MRLQDICTKVCITPIDLMDLIRDRIKMIERARSGKKPMQPDKLCSLFKGMNQCDLCARFFYDGNRCFTLQFYIPKEPKRAPYSAAGSGWGFLEYWEDSKKYPATKTKKSEIFYTLFKSYHYNLLQRLKREAFRHTIVTALEILDNNQRAGFTQQVDLRTMEVS